MSVIAQSGIGALTAIASILPLSSEITRAVAFVAPVEVGINETAAARPLAF